MLRLVLKLWCLTLSNRSKSKSRLAKSRVCSSALTPDQMSKSAPALPHPTVSLPHPTVSLCARVVASSQHQASEVMFFFCSAPN
jgi:hypothetical protein